MPLIFHLVGPMGSGKSTLAETIRRGLGGVGCVVIDVETNEFDYGFDADRIVADYLGARAILIEYFDRAQVRAKPGDQVLQVERIADPAPIVDAVDASSPRGASALS